VDPHRPHRHPRRRGPQPHYARCAQPLRKRIVDPVAAATSSPSSTCATESIAPSAARA
jgi:hypothetical protein